MKNEGLEDKDDEERVIVRAILANDKKAMVTEEVFKSIPVNCNEEAGNFPFPLFKIH